MAPRKRRKEAVASEPTNGSVHQMSLIVGEIKGELAGVVNEVKRAVEHVNSNLKMATEAVSNRIDQIATDFKEHRDTAAETSREAAKERSAIRDRFEDLSGDVSGLKVMALSTQQDVAEMKNDMADAREKLDHMPVIMAAVGKVKDLEQFKETVLSKEQRLLGRWDVIKRQLTLARLVIGAVGAVALGLLGFWLQRFI